MTENAADALIARLSSMTPQAYINYTNHSIALDQKMMSLLDPERLRATYTIPTTRADFDSLYAYLAEYPDDTGRSPQKIVEEQTQILRDLLNASNPIGVQYITERYIGQIRQLSAIAEKRGMPKDQARALLDKATDMSPPSAELTPQEKELTELKQQVAARSLARSPASSPEHAPASSRWAERVASNDRDNQGLCMN